MAEICEMSLTPGFNKEKCEKEFGIQWSCLNKIVHSKTKFLDFADSKKKHSKCNICDIQKWQSLSSTFAYLMVHERKKHFKCVICDASFQKHLKLMVNVSWRKNAI